MKKKTLIISTIVVAIIAGLFVGIPSLAGDKKETGLQTISLAKRDLIDSILVSGTITSSNSKNVYSKLTTYTVKEVYVKEGDKVKAGDLLAKLDTSTLELDIKQTELNILNAEAALENEASSIQTNLQNASNGVKSASIELDNAKRNYDNIKKLADLGVSSPDELIQAESMLKKAQLSYDNALASLKNNQNKNTSSARNNIEIQKVALEKQKKTLNDANIAAQIEGTVTLVNAKAGGSSTGLLFVVEDTENLIISTEIGEFDVGLIKLGQEVTIKTDSTGDKEFTGTVSKVAPTAIKDNSGATAASSNIQFETEITINSKDPYLKIGMTARLTIKLNEKKNVYNVPYDSVITTEDGSNFIYVLESSQNQSVDGAKKVKVQTGMETDMYIEIEAEELKEGLQVLTDPQKISEAANKGVK
ncbi:MAG: transporter [Clostridiales bacterium]|jgi:multidrug efflux pump subunit AcrA (membrane-fusion protein)|nr:transporter [Clostridiales bacterium]